ncbi:hypothetical protein T4B_4157 [Trichinella pseudospiralis]|uniref:Uncharacterized protein n=3 Tax=Trichinella pseudospiralis TaxID=6337 RepID=A0A0V1F7F9_TRIPS|nr:hypothetical protein T4D_11007 [Trichinella pseudospiralis]KRY83365.1 hypothetical protein T4D_1010 [Trichinella pseudospiralis]KRZ08488.1 hypothetical protein T4B_14543 [Trichinella pseudospiralis]KRZ13526.1 hypothetical protein T4B_4157 [Trichinella pseudospiralis]KRZ31288.1 hypothetical protein T4C_10659 [Trichinella pseudospiralis]
MASSRIAIEASSFHGVVDIAFLNVIFDAPFGDKLKLLAADSKFFRKNIYFSDILPRSGH